MILRIVLGRFAPSTDAAALGATRDHLTRVARSVPGLESMLIGVHAIGPSAGDEVTPGSAPSPVAPANPVAQGAGTVDGAVVSVWRDVESMRRACGDGPDDRLIGVHLGLPFQPTGSRHFELVDRAFGALPPEGIALLRIVTIRARPNEEARLVEILRARQPRMMDLGLVGSQVGRRVVAGGEVEALVASLWLDRETVTDAAGRSDLTALPDPEDVAAWQDRMAVEAYDAIEIAPRLPATIGPPLFIVDGELRIVDITATAAAILGLPAEEMVGRRVEDMSLMDPERRRELVERLLEEGSVTGETAWRVPDTGTVSLRFVARRDVPIAGRHAVIVRRRLDPPPTLADLEAAVAEAFGPIAGP